ncbi:MAG: methylenetetrahydrofolate--tRNA-(uracil(54)-C(5))-methyltransferase (FADH(2)-oxidizing) TrmFO [Marivibrio sp.]|uniref:methylenetetrahydrofolate--tRNA-(uracil(54)- C(5))-methyltransferase (FADH(2)-oxidizing) TrmFO n=1 Tax=Marivibrio sp. TaxID=2039719 RepID=UPI0032F028F9
MSERDSIHIIGGGLAGSEAAWQAAEMGARVVLHEMRPVRKTDAHHTDRLAELVCSNSFRSDDPDFNAVGLLHEEMRRCNSLILRCGDAAKVPAGGALAVDRDDFAARVSQAIEDHPNIEIRREEVAGLPPAEWESVIVATGPLTSPGLSQAVLDLTGETQLAFFDAIAPIVYHESIDFSRAWRQSRYDKGDGSDYINCAMDKAQYEAFIQALIDGEKTAFKEWEKDTPYFEGCLPIEVMAERGVETLRYGPMKPVGLTNPHSDERPHAVVQLRQDNKLGTLYNLVGFQTKLKYGAQKDIFRMIPGLEEAEFARLGGIHRNTFLNSPRLLDERLRLKADPRMRFAGQVTGVEGYIESAAIGLIAGRYAAGERLGVDQPAPPAETALGALVAHITTGADAATFQPMNVNFGLFPPLAEEIGVTNKKQRPRGRARKQLLSQRALAALDGWIGRQAEAAE